ncbi:EamA family transporter RarD [Maricaulis salignorans]|uniref:Chloramphenicol-sensitive protein RarD n=1 Tax=Maricaulis salignorans TaxID=144026 RepID=A0A1G9LEE4_9PROT|nr:EamA family transporter RarD [Maricaulis salignorans]SDL60143.1 chloramphenicol-sensitive protein RarD [Maricaulis salignorans]
MTERHSNEIRRSLFAGLAGYVIWGFAPLYFQMVDFAGALEIVAHRVVWSLPMLFAALWFAGKLRPAFAALRDKRVMLILLATSALISVNWLVFVYAVNNGQVLQASLGYYINPLMSVAVGVIVLREPLGPWRITAIVLATLGVLNQIIAVGEVPWISLTLALSFTGYGYLRKIVTVDGRIGLFWETAFITPFALGALIWMQSQGAGHFLQGPMEAALLILAGLITIVPLLLYIIGARGLRLSTMGLLQFTAPSLQFAIGVLRGETFTSAHLLTFGLIWAGVAAFAWSQLRRDRAAVATKV